MFGFVNFVITHTVEERGGGSPFPPGLGLGGGILNGLNNAVGSDIHECDKRGGRARVGWGCAVGCVFCCSGMGGFVRNLTRSEILEELLRLNALLPQDERLTHIVVMGTGEPTLNLDALLPAASRLFVQGRRYRRAGVLLCGIEPAGAAADLFSGDPSETKAAKLSAALDAVNAKFGRGTVFLAATGTERPWKMKRDMLSPCPTTRWKDLLVAR